MFQSFNGRQYLKIDIANNYGLDKLTWDERLSWFDQNEQQLDTLLKTAKEPALFYAGIQAWRDVQADKPIGYMISLDATSSGLQLLAALTGDRSAAQLCNVVDVGTRMDAYTAIYQALLEAVGGTAKVTRDDVKQAIMTAFYSSKATPKKVFGEGELLGTFYQVLETLAPAAWELNEAMMGLWNPEAYSHDWVLPDNFHVKTKVMDTVTETVHFLDEPIDVHYKINAPMEQGRSLGANTVHSVDGMVVREMTRRCDYDPEQVERIQAILNHPHRWEARTVSQDDKMVAQLWLNYKASGYLSARILDHIQFSNAGLIDDISQVQEIIDLLPPNPFKVISVHDCFRCLPHYGNDLRRQYNLQLELIAKSNLLQWIISQLIGKPVSIGKLDPLLWQDISNTNYALS